MNRVDEVRFEYLNSQKSVELLTSAIRTGNLPSRPSHVSLIFSPALKLPYELLARVFSSVANVLKMLCVTCCAQKGGSLKLLGYRVLRLLLIDPIHILSVVVIAAIKVTSAFFGIFMPSIAAHGFLLAEHIQRLAIGLKVFFRDKLVIPSANPKIENWKINPRTAVTYLTLERALVCRQIDLPAAKRAAEGLYVSCLGVEAMGYMDVLKLEYVRKSESNQDPKTFTALLAKIPKELSAEYFDSKEYGALVNATVLERLNKNNECKEVDEVQYVYEHLTRIRDALKTRAESNNGSPEEDQVKRRLDDLLPLVNKHLTDYKASKTNITEFGSVPV